MFEQQIMDWLQRHASQNQRHGILQYGWPVKSASSLCATFFFVLAGIGIYQEVRLTLVGGLSLFGVSCCFGVLEAFCVFIKYDNHYIYTHSPWRANRMIDWDDLVEVRYSYFAQWYVVRTKRSGNIRLPRLLSGTGYFFEQLEARGLNLPIMNFPNQ